MPLQLITNNGRSVHPSNVSLREQDPLEAADYFQEGVHYVPETEDFLRALGHFADSDAHLIMRRQAQIRPLPSVAWNIRPMQIMWHACT